MSAFLLILGIPLTLFGAVISLGVAVEIFEGTSDYTLATDLAGLVLLGIGPMAGGLFLCWRALSRIKTSE